MKAHPETPWEWRWLSYNPNLTWEFVQTHSELNCEWCSISYNLFLYNDTVYQRSLQQDVQVQQERVASFLLPYVCSDVLGQIVGYVSYD